MSYFFFNLLSTKVKTMRSNLFLYSTMIPLTTPNITPFINSTPLRTGDITVSFTFTKRVTDDEKVRYFSSGDRDDFKKLDTKNYPMVLPPLKLHIKALPKETQLVGDFHLDYTVNTHQAKAYAPISMQVILKGKGYPPHIKDLIPTSKHYTLFGETPQIKTSPAKKGFIATAAYLFALSADKNFTLPQITLNAFSPHTQKSYTLSIPKQHFDIQSVDTKSLIDSIDNPPELKADWQWLKSLLSYLVVFAAGFLSAMVLKIKKRHIQEQMHPLIVKIKETKDAKSLLQLLMAQDSHQFRQSIEKLEDALYQNAKIDLSKVKQEIMEK